MGFVIIFVVMWAVIGIVIGAGMLFGFFGLLLVATLAFSLSIYLQISDQSSYWSK